MGQAKNLTLSCAFVLSMLQEGLVAGPVPGMAQFTLGLVTCGLLEGVAGQ